MSELVIDKLNKRIKCFGPQIVDYQEFVQEAKGIAIVEKLEKIWLIVKEKDVVPLVRLGVILEGKIAGYFNGQTGYSMALYMSEARADNSDLVITDRYQIGTIESSSYSVNIPQGYKLRLASKDDINEMISVFAQVFETYPTPITDADYLLESMNAHVLFMVVEYHGRIVSIASAEMDNKNKNAELTDCVTLPEARGKGLMKVLVCGLEQQMLQRGINNLFSIARVKSKGINEVYHQLGYSYGGTLTNNCHICGNYENMNIWSKIL